MWKAPANAKSERNTSFIIALEAQPRRTPKEAVFQRRPAKVHTRGTNYVARDISKGIVPEAVRINEAVRPGRGECEGGAAVSTLLGKCSLARRAA
jgi:hypothetical protein